MSSSVEELIEPLVRGLGCIYVGIQQFPQGKHSLIRLYIDKPGGVTVDDCERVSRQVGAALDVEFPKIDQYILEVSSPGLDRILFKPEQYQAYLNRPIAVQLKAMVQGQRNFKGILKEVRDSKIGIEKIEGRETKKDGKKAARQKERETLKSEAGAEAEVGTCTGTGTGAEAEWIYFSFSDIQEARLLPELEDKKK